MKLFAVLLSLLGLSLLQEHPVAHACKCKKISSIVEDKVQEATAGMEGKLGQVIDTVNTINTTLASTLEKVEMILTQQPMTEKPSAPPNSSENPSPSCKDIYEKDPSAPSGYYWIGESGSAVRVYCSMEETCGSETGGWMRVANIDMRNTSQNCPSRLTLLTSPKRLCDLPAGVTNACVGNTFSAAGVRYSRVCGKIIGYQNKAPYAFYYHDRGIDADYVSGVSLTHGTSPRRHIWTFAGAIDESTQLHYARWKCPCMDSRATVPSYVGNDYFCDTALSQFVSSHGNNRLETSDPLWDGEGCATSSCCSFNTPPWFVRDLSSPTTDDIEMRVCITTDFGTTPIEIMELYVQ